MCRVAFGRVRVPEERRRVTGRGGEGGEGMGSVVSIAEINTHPITNTLISWGGCIVSLFAAIITG